MFSLRCALPMWLDRLPSWGGGSVYSQRLRTLRPVLWSQQIVDGIAALCPIWIALKAAARSDRGAAAERAAVRTASAKAEQAMNVLSMVLHGSLPWDVGYSVHPRRDEWWAYLAMGVVTAERRGICGADSSVMQTVPLLVDAVVAVQPGDSGSSIAARCVWRQPVGLRLARALED
jgi:hypothetical protein